MSEKKKNTKEEKPKKKGRVPRFAGCLLIRTGNTSMREAAGMRPPRALFPHLVFEGECSCLFSDTNTGKSIFAVQLGCEIAAQGLVVAYYDFELSLRQFYERYHDYGTRYTFPDTFYRIETNPESDYIGDMLNDIEGAAVKIGAQVLIIDNITWICSDSEEASSASTFMKNIKKLQKKYGWTINIIAHTPKRNDAMPITVNDLAGSKQFANFFDTIFALGRCNTVKNLRYLKQIKIRAEETTYSSDAVMALSIEKVDGRLMMVEHEPTTEKIMLCDAEQLEAEQFAETVRDMASIGMSDKEIAAQTGETSAKIKKMTRGMRMLARMKDPSEGDNGEVEYDVVSTEGENNVQEAQ